MVTHQTNGVIAANLTLLLITTPTRTIGAWMVTFETNALCPRLIKIISLQRPQLLVMAVVSSPQPPLPPQLPQRHLVSKAGSLTSSVTFRTTTPLASMMVEIVAITPTPSGTFIAMDTQTVFASKLLVANWHIFD